MGIDGITDEILKYEGEAVTDKINAVCNHVSWMEGKVPGDWTTTTVPVNNKCSEGESRNRESVLHPVRKLIISSSSYIQG